MKRILGIIGFKYICNVNSMIKSKDEHDLSCLNEYSGDKGVFVFTESDEIIYVGRTDDLKKRIGQCLRGKNDTGSICSVEKLTDAKYERLLCSNLYIMEVNGETFKADVKPYCNI